jgi:hypothetical protein
VRFPLLKLDEVRIRTILKQTKAQVLVTKAERQAASTPTGRTVLRRSSVGVVGLNLSHDVFSASYQVNILDDSKPSAFFKWSTTFQQSLLAQVKKVKRQRSHLSKLDIGMA